MDLLKKKFCKCPIYRTFFRIVEIILESETEMFHWFWSFTRVSRNNRTAEVSIHRTLCSMWKRVIYLSRGTDIRQSKCKVGQWKATVRKIVDQASRGSQRRDVEERKYRSRSLNSVQPSSRFPRLLDVRLSFSYRHDSSVIPTSPVPVWRVVDIFVDVLSSTSKRVFFQSLLS